MDVQNTGVFCTCLLKLDVQAVFILKELKHHCFYLNASEIQKIKTSPRPIIVNINKCYAIIKHFCWFRISSSTRVLGVLIHIIHFNNVMVIQKQQKTGVAQLRSLSTLRFQVLSLLLNFTPFITNVSSPNERNILEEEIINPPVNKRNILTYSFY